MIVFKKRLIFWLIKAYIKKWGKAIIFFFLLGLVFFFIFRSTVPILLTRFGIMPKETIGVVGAYTITSLPPAILSQISRGLTKISDKGTPIPDLASSWKITDNGKTYTFYLQKNVYFSDGTLFTSKDITASFRNVTITRPNDYTISFHLEDSYAPFFVTMSRPIFKSGFVGLGEYKIKKATFNGSFIQSLMLISVNEPYVLHFYEFYPSQEALKIAYALGEISIAQNLSDISFENTSFSSFPNSEVTKSIDYAQLITIFYNTQDATLSDKRLRDALSYTIPDTFTQGQRTYSPISPLSFAYSLNTPHNQDFTHAKLLLKAAADAGEKVPKLTITTLPKFKDTAMLIQKEWQKVGVESTVE
ncbi:MAG: ABC transporter substrate-binding protein, partial [Candidatus Levyibacteriota bacterium]